MEIDTKYFADKLSAEKSLLESELNNIAVKNPDNPSDWNILSPESGSPDSRDDVAERFEEMDQRKAEEQTLEKQLARVNDALERISNGSYGHCTVCKKEIETERLEASPAATTCLEHIEEEA